MRIPRKVWAPAAVVGALALALAFAVPALASSSDGGYGTPTPTYPTATPTQPLPTVTVTVTATPTQPTPTPTPTVNPFADCRFSQTDAFTFSSELGRFIRRSVPAIVCVGPWHRVRVFDQLNGGGF